MTVEVSLGGVLVGDDHPTAFVAELGTSFGQDVDAAEASIRAAVAAGVDIVKSEILHTADVCLPTDVLHVYAHAGGQQAERYRDLIERKVVPLDGYRALAALCRELGVPFLASVYDRVGIDLLVEVGAAGVKLARDNIDNAPLLRHAAASGLPLVFDAGGVTFAEVAAAVDAARRAGAADIVINHHPGANPAPPAVHHLRTIRRYRDAFGVPIGLSCHYAGEEVLYAAVGAGAALVEKAVDVDPTRVEQDVVSATPLADLPRVVAAVRACADAMGRADAEPVEPRDRTTRRCLVAARRLDVGELISADTTDTAFPPLGIPVSAWDLVEGATVARPLASRQVITWADVELAGG